MPVIKVNSLRQKPIRQWSDTSDDDCNLNTITLKTSQKKLHGLYLFYINAENFFY